MGKITIFYDYFSIFEQIGHKSRPKLAYFAETSRRKKTEYLS